MEELKESQKNNESTESGEKKVGKIKSLARQEDRKDRIAEIRKIFTRDIFSDEDDIKEFDKLDLIKRPSKKQKERMDELETELVIRHGLQNGLWIKNLSYGKYYPVFMKMRHDIAEEYSCKTASELMLADRIVASYWRAMRFDTILNRFIEGKDGTTSFDQLKVNVLKEFNKGVELSSRQLNADIILLKELKQPRINIKVKTDNAYLAQNQQININSEKDENIEPK